MKSTTIGHVKDRKAYVYYESLLVSNCEEKKKVKKRNNVFLKGVITRKRRYNAKWKGVITPFMHKKM